MAEPPPQPPEELWEEILVRLPPDDPATLVRASLVCRQWRRLVSGRAFLRRLLKIHRVRPMLGFFCDRLDTEFVPTTAFALSVPEGLNMPRSFDCRHGRALLVSFENKRAFGDSLDILVWEPITGYQRRLPVPSSIDLGGCFNAAVVCAMDGCDHRDCHGGPFRVVFVASSENTYDPGTLALACEYSSETSAWGKPVSATTDSAFSTKGSLLVGKSLYFLCDNSKIFEYKLGGQSFVAIDPAGAFRTGSIMLIQAEDGGLELPDSRGRGSTSGLGRGVAMMMESVMQDGS